MSIDATREPLYNSDTFRVVA